MSVADPQQLVDQIDLRILQALRDHPRTNMSDLAHMANVSRPTLKSRLDRMWSNGVIIGLEPQLDLGKIGLNIQAWIQVHHSPADLDAFASHLDSMPAVIEAFLTTGQSNVSIRVACRDLPHLADVLQEISDPGHTKIDNSSVIIRPLVTHRKISSIDLLDL